ncbi:hypothetical protein [Pinibacter aurantiacus]|uniref:ParB/Sulfiredoxin domain-containing protein n=1 Tax=Pinibacter aurantiacus TaxID=2851599 RepID=A0A9E2S7Y0_9BACT|nr:hypothetical protein [Pinibacter aurantiacus]MBV4357891.1 hypothetical protein [Pinibacter aurantiacus]
MKQISKDFLLDFIEASEIELRCTQEKLCVPIVERIYRKMRAGIKFPNIKVDDDVICDGHHRYLASLIADYPLDIDPSFKTSATKTVFWKSITFDENDWDTRAKVNILNEHDALYNNIGMDALLEMLK